MNMWRSIESLAASSARDKTRFGFAKQGKSVTNISLQVLEAKHERELNVGVLRQQFGGRCQRTSISEQCTIESML